MQKVHECFQVLPDAEIAIEADPRAVTPNLIAAFAETKVTRVSIGVQTFEQAVQKAINRLQSFNETAAFVGEARAAGINRFNVDLIYGLPNQTVTGCLETVAQVLELGCDRLSVFGYAHVPSFKQHQHLISQKQLPNGKDRLLQFEAIASALVVAGYEKIGLDHFARLEDALTLALKRGRLHRNFQGYTDDSCDILLGFGASAISTLPLGYMQNDSTTSSYIKTVERGILPVTRGYALTAEDRMRREVIETLMCQMRVDLQTIAVRYGVDVGEFTRNNAMLDELVDDGIAKHCGSEFVVNEEYRTLLRNVAAAFDVYLRLGSAKHSLAV
jgi:oxygen-independent coproporphyrinogen-3 oxidase